MHDPSNTATKCRCGSTRAGYDKVWFYYGYTLFDSNVWILGCEVVALRENFVDRPERYDSCSTKSYIFVMHE
jgi:hypothetical protein